MGVGVLSPHPSINTPTFPHPPSSLPQSSPPTPRTSKIQFLTHEVTSPTPINTGKLKLSSEENSTKKLHLVTRTGSQRQQLSTTECQLCAWLCALHRNCNTIHGAQHTIKMPGRPALATHYMCPNWLNADNRYTLQLTDEQIKAQGGLPLQARGVRSGPRGEEVGGGLSHHPAQGEVAESTRGCGWTTQNHAVS